MRGVRISRIGIAVVAIAGMVLAAGAAKIGQSAQAQDTPAGNYIVRAGPGGTIRGRVLYTGKPIRPMTMVNTEDPQYCGNTMTFYPLQVEKGGVMNAVVWIDNIRYGKPFSYPKPVINQKMCMFVPSVVLMAPGQLEVKNSDPVSHDVQVFARFNRSSNFSMPPGSKPVELTLMRPETVTVACDIHKDMVSHVVVAKNPYYTLTRSGGAFELTDVPPGTYQLKVWQQKLGTQMKQITVHAGKTSVVTFKAGA